MVRETARFSNLPNLTFCIPLPRFWEPRPFATHLQMPVPATAALYGTKRVVALHWAVRFVLQYDELAEQLDS